MIIGNRRHPKVPFSTCKLNEEMNANKYKLNDIPNHNFFVCLFWFFNEAVQSPRTEAYKMSWKVWKAVAQCEGPHFGYFCKDVNSRKKYVRNEKNAPFPHRIITNKIDTKVKGKIYILIKQKYHECIPYYLILS